MALSYQTIQSSIQTLSNLHAMPADAAAAAQNLSQAPDGTPTTALQLAGAGVDAAKAGLAILEAVGRSVPVVGTLLGASSLGLNVASLGVEYQNGTITAGTLSATFSDVSALAASAVFAGAVVASAPAAITVGVALTVLSAGLKIASIHPSVKDVPTIEQSDIDNLSQVVQDLVASAETGFLSFALSLSDFLSELGSSITDSLASGVLGAIELFADFVSKPAYGAEIGAAVRFDPAQRWLQPIRRDPLTFDLDGDGLETTGFDAAHPIYFDHDANGVMEGTGWVNSDDGFLVLDRNGNGTIDDGTELFGDHTALSGGGYAADGFAALAAEDTNADGNVDAADAHFSQLRLWRDLNQDGVSQADELFTLESQGIASIGVARLTFRRDRINLGEEEARKSG